MKECPTTSVRLLPSDITRVPCNFTPAPLFVRDSGITGGNPEMIETIAKAAIATGVDGIFLETHPNPSQSKSDGANMLQLNKLEELLVKLVKIRKAI